MAACLAVAAVAAADREVDSKMAQTHTGTQPLISLQNIYKIYQMGDMEVRANDGISLDIYRGEFVSIVGKSGSGKSTIMNILTGYLAPTEGEVKVAGFRLPEQAQQAKACVGYLPEQPPLYPEMTVQEYLDFAAELKGVKKAQRREQVQQAARRTGLDQVMPRLIRSLSKGYRQRVGIAQALLGSPQLIILDEPTSGLDVVARDTVLDLIREYLEEDERRSVLISSHIAGDLEKLCDDLYMIHDGHIVFHEETDVLLSEYGLLKVSAQQYDRLDKRYLLRMMKESFGISCLTSEKRYYEENYPGIVIEKGSIDEMITMMVKGENVK